MPIYEYDCETCKSREEIIQKFDEKTPEECPNCHAKGTLKKVVTSSAFHLKGGGWYKDLYSSTKTEGTKSKDAAPSKETKKEESKKPKTDD